MDRGYTCRAGGQDPASTRTEAEREEMQRISANRFFPVASKFYAIHATGIFHSHQDIRIDPGNPSDELLFYIVYYII